MNIADLTRDELLIIVNALNEVCNGIAIDEAEFETRLGASRSEARLLLQKLSLAHSISD